MSDNDDYYYNSNETIQKLGDITTQNNADMQLGGITSKSRDTFDTDSPNYIAPKNTSLYNSNNDSNQTPSTFKKITKGLNNGLGRLYERKNDIGEDIVYGLKGGINGVGQLWEKRYEMGKGVVKAVSSGKNTFNELLEDNNTSKLGVQVFQPLLKASPYNQSFGYKGKKSYLNEGEGIGIEDSFDKVNPFDKYAL